MSPVVNIPAGTHNVKLTVQDGKGGMDMDTVTVNVRALMLTPPELTFVRPQGADPESKPFFVKALGGTLPYNIARTASWLDASVESGSSSGESDQIMAIADPGGLAPGSYTGQLVANGPGVIKESLWAKLIVTAVSVPGLDPPDPEENGVVDAADFIPFGEPGHPMAPLSLVIISGQDFVPEGEFSADSLPLPTTLGGVMVLFDGIPGRLIFVSSTVIIAQLPEGLTPPVTEMVITNGNEKAASAPQNVSIATHSPGIFTLAQNGQGQGIVTFAGGGDLAAPDGTVGDSRPATEGDNLTIWANGLGPVDPPIELGQNSCEPDGVCEPDGSNAVLHHTLTTPVIRIGDLIVPESNVLFSGSSVASVGIYEVVFTMPAGVETGPDVPLTIDIGGVTSNEVTIAVE